jgi:hypothetical protein
MTQRHINSISKGDSLDNSHIPPAIGAALGTVLTGISAVQLKKGGLDYVSLGFGVGGMTIKGVCDYLLATTQYHQDLREHEADRRNLNGSRTGARPGDLELERQRLRVHACEYETMPVRFLENDIVSEGEGQSPEHDTN